MLVLCMPACAWAMPDPTDLASCKAMQTTDFNDLIDAPTNIASTAFVPASKDQKPGVQDDYRPDSFAATPITTKIERAQDLPAYCRVIGIIAPQIKFELRLPVVAWNGKYLQQGCGGMCGIVNMEAAEDALIRGYAVLNTNMGHEGNAGTTLWAKDNVPLRADFGWRATHVAFLAGTALVERFYGTKPRFTYFRGYSTGGDQALSETQRFPEDFNGVIAVAPVSGGAFPLVWAAHASVDANGKRLFNPDKIAMVHKAVLHACGGDQDGFLEDPRPCHWDPASLQCKAGDAADCLTGDEITVMNKIYDGDKDAKGWPLSHGMPRGSELEWVPLYIASNVKTGWSSTGNLPMWMSKGVSYVVRDLDFWNDPGPGYSMLTMNFEDYYRSAKLTAPFRFDLNPDLREFKAEGGKLILAQGWNDPEVPARGTVDYYEAVLRAMGGADKTTDFFRMFMVPGMAHTRGGEGADAIDYLSALEAWVEHGHAPAFLLTYHLKIPQNYMGLPVLRYPLGGARYDWTRPVFAYPAVPAWNGTGDRTKAEHWVAGSVH